MSITPGQTIGQYIIQNKLGEGGMGAVYKANQPTIHRSVALKVLSASFANDPDALDRFKREVDMIAELEHPYILPVYDFGQVDDNPYIVMRYMSGGTLYHRLRDNSLSQAQLLRVLRQVAEALDYAHNRDVVHRDLKPANVLLDESGNACLADFGLAKTMAGSRDLTATGSILGTPEYMSPEQARGDKLDARSDIYSFAVMVYQALSGQLPFVAKTSMEYIFKHLTEEPPSIVTVAPRLPPAVGEVLRRAMSKDRLRRPARATQLMDELEAGLAGRPPDLPASRPAPARTVAAAPHTETLAAGQVGLGQPAQSAPRGAHAAAVAAAVAGAPARRSGALWLVLGVVVLGAMVLVVLLAGAGVFALSGRLGNPKVATYPVGDSPRALLFDGQSIWVMNALGATLSQLTTTGCAANPDPCGKTSQVVKVDQLPTAMAFSADGKTLWVTFGLNSSLVQFDPATRRVVATFRLPNVPTALLRVGDDLWVANQYTGTVTHVSSDGAIIGDYPAGSKPVALAYDGTHLWAANQEAATLTQLDPATGAILASFQPGGQPAALAFDGAHLWAALSDKNAVAELDPASGSVLATVAVGGRPVSLLFDGATLWSADQAGNSVTRIDVSKAAKLTTIAVPGGPYALAWAACGAGCGDLWVAGEANNTVSRVRVTGQ
jgi:DNA-binding beta-propeller fold protein YncE